MSRLALAASASLVLGDATLGATDARAARMLARAAFEDSPLTADEVCGNVALSPGQVRVLASDSPITVALAGIRGGKTHVGALKTIFYALEHPCSEDEHHLVLSPTYQMSKVPVEKLFKLLYDKALFPICPLLRYVKSERTFILAALDGTTTRITVRSLHDPDRLRGLKALSAWIDEGAYVSAYAWDVVQGRLADAGGPCWITTTPAGYNWVFELYERAREEARLGVAVVDREVRVVHWTSLENTFVSESGFARLLGSFDARTYQQEVEARFIKARGLVYHAFTRAANVRPCKLNPSLPLWVGQDFNVDPMASVLMQPLQLNGNVSSQGAHVIGERKARDSDTYRLVEFLDNFITEHKVPKRAVTIYPDASGKARSTSGKSDFFILRAAGFRVDAPAKNPLVKDRVNCVNGLFKPMKASAPRLLVDPSCVQLIESLERQVYKPDSDPPEPDKEHGFDHLNEALGYPCWRRWPLRTAASLGKSRENRKAA